MHISTSGLILFNCLLFLFFSGDTSASTVDGSEIIGEYAPNFEYFDFKREIHRLYDLKGTVCVVAFWQPEDENCERALKALESIHNSYKDAGVKVVAINIRGRTTDVLLYLAQQDMNYLFLEGILSDALNAWKIEGVPSVFIIDKEMRVKDYIPGIDEGYERRISTVIDLLLKQ